METMKSNLVIVVAVALAIAVVMVRMYDFQKS